MGASDDEIRRVLELALEYDLALRVTAGGDVEVFGELGVRPAPKLLEPGPPASPSQDVEPSRDALAPHVRCLVGEGHRLQRSIRRQDLIPQKRVAYEVGVSQTTLWRASKSGLPDFPPPVIVRKKVYWRKADLTALEEALMYFQGRGVFESQRKEPRGPG